MSKADIDFKIEKARAQIVMDHPFVASILLRHPAQPREDIKALAIDGRGQIFYNPKFIDSITVPQVVWCFARMTLRRIGMHVQRQQRRDHKKWTHATAVWTNDTLEAANIGTKVDGAAQQPGAKDETCENLYANMPDNPNGNGKGKGKGQGKGQGQGQGSGQGQGGEGDGEGYGDKVDNDAMGDDLLSEGVPQTESEMKEQEAEIKLEVAAAAQSAKARDKLPGVLAKLAADVIDVKTPWHEILERHMVAMTKGDYSWRKPNRRFIGGGIYLPSVGQVPKMGKVVFQVDISGSVSQQEIKYYNGHIKRIVELCHPEEVHVIYTDTRVCKHEVFECGEEVEIRFYSGGGTDMREGFTFIDKEGIEPEVFITLTDGYTPFPARTDYSTIWVISSDIKAPTAAGETIHFEMERQ